MAERGDPIKPESTKVDSFSGKKQSVTIELIQAKRDQQQANQSSGTENKKRDTLPAG
jgi:hypothetical protein